ncbi:MAG: glycosyltransferase family 4 protein [Pseudomonadota bacterium]
MRIAIVTDAWHPQVNGVVTTMSTVVDWLRGEGHHVGVIEPNDFRTMPCPGYPEIRLALNPGSVARRLAWFEPDCVHVATEGPLGRAAMGFLRRGGWAHTTSFHTRFPEYLRARLPIVPLDWGYGLLRRFHADSRAVLVPTAGMARELEERGFENLRVWGRGVDTDLFHPEAARALQERPEPGPVALYAGRVAVEKNIEAFLAMEWPGTKVVVGDGPERARLQRAHPEVVFPGYQYGRSLAAWYASADVFVFPSRTDTLGVVMLEAMACGTPVAAYPVTGPADVVEHGVTGCLDNDLQRAAEQALWLDRTTCRRTALAHDQRAMAREFLDALVPVRVASRSPAMA